MKYAIAFVLSFVVAAGAGALWRARTPLEAPLPETRPTPAAPAPAPAPSAAPAHNHQAAPPPANVPQPVLPPLTQATELKNTTDPVGGEPIRAGDDFSWVYKGFRVRFATERNRLKFQRNPVRYLQKLGLEMQGEALAQVDADSYRDARPAVCPLMGNEIPADSDVFILHRGWRIYFCCWEDCWEQFLAEPARYYDAYGLQEQGGQLVAKP